MAKERIRVKGSYPQGYTNAIQWYQKLRAQFAQELQNNLIAIGEKQAQITANNLSNILLEFTSKESEKLSQASVEELQDIALKYIDSIISTDNQLKADVQTARSNIALNNMPIADQVELIRGLSNKIKNDFGRTQDLSKLLESIISKKYNIQQKKANDRFDAVIRRAQELISVALVAKLGAYSQLYSTSLRTMAGYIAEDIEYRAIGQFAENKLSNILKITPGGTKTSSQSLQTHQDNILHIMDYLDEAFTDQIDIVQAYSFSPLLEEELLTNIKFYGEQVKTFSLAKKSRTGKLYGVRISEQSEMRKQFETATNGNVYDIYENVKFVGKYQHILRSFGADTLLFTNSDGRYFMDDFIKEFKRQNYYLIFGYDQTDQGKYRVSKTIVLDQPWYSRTYGKSQRTTKWYTAKPYK